MYYVYAEVSLWFIGFQKHAMSKTFMVNYSITLKSWSTLLIIGPNIHRRPDSQTVQIPNPMGDQWYTISFRDLVQYQYIENT